MLRMTCPKCSTGRLVPERMHADDSRRFCFDCSKSTGRLVRMISPKRERQAAKRKAKAKAKRDALPKKVRTISASEVQQRKCVRIARTFMSWKLCDRKMKVTRARVALTHNDRVPTLEIRKDRCVFYDEIKGDRQTRFGDLSTCLHRHPSSFVIEFVTLFCNRFCESTPDDHQKFREQMMTRFNRSALRRDLDMPMLRVNHWPPRFCTPGQLAGE